MGVLPAAVRGSGTFVSAKRAAFRRARGSAEIGRLVTAIRGVWRWIWLFPSLRHELQVQGAKHRTVKVKHRAREQGGGGSTLCAGKRKERHLNTLTSHATVHAEYITRPLNITRPRLPTTSRSARTAERHGPGPHTARLARCRTRRTRSAARRVRRRSRAPAAGRRTGSARRGT